MTMRRSSREGLVSGLILGVLIAFGFALLIRLIPANLLVEMPSRAVLYAIQVPAALIFVPIARGVARIRSERPRLVLLWACVGALAFDGLALGFWPSLYGQEGVAQAIIAALLLWAFAWIVAAALLVIPDDVAPAA
jgi:RsiW-degrading membrane proteinase PrsW (M82 family)